MTRPCVFALGITVGCLIAPTAQILAARACGKHYLETKEQSCPAST